MMLGLSAAGWAAWTEPMKHKPAEKDGDESVLNGHLSSFGSFCAKYVADGVKILRDLRTSAWDL